MASDLPEAVRRAVERDLHGDRVVNVELGAARSYRVTQLAGGKEINMVLKSDGLVDWMSSQQLHAHRFDKH